MTKTDPPSQLLRTLISTAYSPDNAQIGYLPDPQAEREWKSLFFEAKKNGLDPLLYWVLQPLKSNVPANYFEALHKSYLSAATHNLVTARDLEQFLSEIRSLELEKIILLKGAALFQGVYPDPALRPMLDIDILIPFTQLPNVSQRLKEFGYVQTTLFPSIDQTGYFWSQVSLHHTNKTRTPIELHWHLLDNPYFNVKIPFDAYWQAAIPATNEDTFVYILAPEDQILHLCAHNIFHHRGTYHRTAVDIGFIISYYQDLIDWKIVVSKASQYGLGFSAHVALSTAKNEWRAAVPGEALEALERDGSAGRSRLFMTAQNYELLKVLRTLLTLPNWRMKISYAKSQLFPSRDYLIWRYHLQPNIPLPVAYLKRFGSGLKSLVFEPNRPQSFPD